MLGIVKLGLTGVVVTLGVVGGVDMFEVTGELDMFGVVLTLTKPLTFIGLLVGLLGVLATFAETVMFVDDAGGVVKLEVVGILDRLEEGWVLVRFVIVVFTVVRLDVFVGLAVTIWFGVVVTFGVVVEVFVILDRFAG